MTPVDPLLDIPGRSAATNGSEITKPAALPALPVRRSIDPASFWLVTAISLGALAATVALSSFADLPSAAPTRSSVTQSSIISAVPAASEPPVVLRGQAPPKAKRI